MSELEVTGGEITSDHTHLLEWMRRRNTGQEVATTLLRKRRQAKPEFYRSPIDLSEGRSGVVSIQHRLLAGTAPIIGTRQAFLRGCWPVCAVLNDPLRVHDLLEDDQGVWMSDTPEELNQIAEALHVVRPAGTVLVGGLGLGVMATTLVALSFVERVVVVERSADVIALCAGSGYEVVHADLREYLLTCPEPFDFWMLDTWRGTSETTWWEEVLPLRRIIANRFGRQQVHCWAEDIMLGQVVPAAACGAGFNWYYKAIPHNPAPDQLRRFFRDIGLPTWERRHGDAVNDVLAEYSA